MRTWYAASEIAGLPGVPMTKHAVIAKAKREAWANRPRKGKGGGLVYSVRCLPLEIQEFLARSMARPAAAKHLPHSRAWRYVVASLLRATGLRIIRVADSLQREGD